MPTTGCNPESAPGEGALSVTDTDLLYCVDFVRFMQPPLPEFLVAAGV